MIAYHHHLQALLQCFFFPWVVWVYLWNTFKERFSSKVLCSKWEGGCGKDFWGNRCSRPWRSSGNLSSVLHMVPKPLVGLDTWAVCSACFRRAFICLHTLPDRRGGQQGQCGGVPFCKAFSISMSYSHNSTKALAFRFSDRGKESVCNSERSTKEWNIYPFDMFVWAHEKWMGNVE